MMQALLILLDVHRIKATVCMEINTEMDVSKQVLRHAELCFVFLDYFCKTALFIKISLRDILFILLIFNVLFTLKLSTM